MARYSIEEYVRWEDIDAAGIINYQAYLRFFALAEAELLRSAGLHYRFLFESLGIWLPRVRVECNFYRPVKLDELLVVEAYFSRIGRTSIQLDFEVGREIKLGTLRGRPQVVAMFFTRCEYACPILVSELKSIEDRLSPEVRRKTDPSDRVATGRYVLVCVRQRDFEPVPVPAEIRDRIAKFSESAAPTSPPR